MKYYHFPNRVTLRFIKQAYIFRRQYLWKYDLIFKIKEIFISNRKPNNTSTNRIKCAFGEYFLEILWSSCENFRLLAEAKCHAVLENNSKKLWNLLHTQNFYIIVSEPISKGAECPQVSYRTDSFGYTWPMTSFIYCSTGCCGARDNQFCCDEKPHM